MLSRMMTAEEATQAAGAWEIEWRCPQCLAPHREAVHPPGVGPWKCTKCEAVQPAQSRALSPEGEIVSCPVCDCRDLYRHRDFNRRLGLAIIVVGALLAPWTKFISLVVCALIDFAIYRFVGEVVICYACKSVLRRSPGAQKIPAFDLNVSEKYIDIERRRGW